MTTEKVAWSSVWRRKMTKHLVSMFIPLLSNNSLSLVSNLILSGHCHLIIHQVSLNYNSQFDHLESVFHGDFE